MCRNISLEGFLRSHPRNSSVVECQFEGWHDVLWESHENSIGDGPEAAWFFMCQHSRAGPIPSARCVLTQHAAPRTPNGGLWSFVKHAGIGAAFLAFGLTVYCSHKRQKTVPIRQQKQSNFLF